MNLVDIVRQATRAWRREPWLTALVVLAISAGVAAGTTMIAVVRTMSADPVPHISGQLYVPRFDASEPGFAAATQWDPGEALTWIDAQRLLHARRAQFQAASAGSRAVIRQEGAGLRPFHASGRMVTSEFFALFDAPFREGSAWGSSDETEAARVVVLNDGLARKLFGHAAAVGKTVHMAGHAFRVVGVLDDWHPRPLFYANIHGDSAFSAVDAYFIPLSTAMSLQSNFAGSMACWASDPQRTGDGCAWLQVWLRLPTQADVRRYADFLAADWKQQQAIGRRIPEGMATLQTFNERMRAMQLVPADVRLQLWLAFGLLAVCIANAAAVLMARTHRRAKEFGIRRAVGASLADLRWQLCIEALGIGAAVAGVGIVVTFGAMVVLRQRASTYADLLHIDGMVALATIALSIVAALLATLAPLHVVARLPLNAHLKSP